MYWHKRKKRLILRTPYRPECMRLFGMLEKGPRSKLPEGPHSGPMAAKGWSYLKMAMPALFIVLPGKCRILLWVYKKGQRAPPHQQPVPHIQQQTPATTSPINQPHLYRTHHPSPVKSSTPITIKIRFSKIALFACTAIGLTPCAT